MKKVPKFVKSNTQLMIESIKDINPHQFAIWDANDISGNDNVMTFTKNNKKIKIIINPVEKTYTLYINKKRTTNLDIPKIVEILNMGQ
jgi:hypothetical protein